MSTLSKGCHVSNDQLVCQGDVFKDVRYCYIDTENDDTVDILEFIFPMAIVVSQACDVNSMSEMIDQKQGKATKFMPSVLLCPIYSKSEAKSMKHLNVVFSELSITQLDTSSDSLFSSKDFGVVENDWHYRYHALKVQIGKDKLDDAIIDFKHYFSVPMSYLMSVRENRLFRLESLFAEQITLKFATFLSRVAIP